MARLARNSRRNRRAAPLANPAGPLRPGRSAAPLPFFLRRSASSDSHNSSSHVHDDPSSDQQVTYHPLHQVILYSNSHTRLQSPPRKRRPPKPNQYRRVLHYHHCVRLSSSRLLRHCPTVGDFRYYFATLHKPANTHFGHVSVLRSASALIKSFKSQYWKTFHDFLRITRNSLFEKNGEQQLKKAQKSTPFPELVSRHNCLSQFTYSDRKSTWHRHPEVRTHISALLTIFISLSTMPRFKKSC